MEATQTFLKPKIRPNIANMVKGPGGSYHKDDAIGNLLSGLSVEQVMTIASESGVDVSKYDHLNNGQKRMTIGGILRKKIKTVDGAELTDKQKESNQDAADCLAQITRLADGFRADNAAGNAADSTTGNDTDSEGGTLD